MDFGIIEDLLHDEQTPPTDIKVLGIGGGGGNAINRMIENGLKKVTFVALNTDVQALQRSNAQVRIPIGKELTGGLGAGGIPEMGTKAAEESKDEIREVLEGTDMVFITAGMGGGTGTGAAPVVAEIAKGMNILTVAVVTTPFAFEGRKKLQFANEGIDRLRKNVDTLILIPNQYLLKVAENNTPIKQAFLMADDVLRQGVQGISELITEPGEINIDFADVRTVMKGKGDAIMGIGMGEGANRAVDAARQAISNPLLENARIDGAKSVLVNLTASDGLTLQEYQDVVEMITENCDQDALIIAGQAYNPDLGDTVKVTVVATGFERENVNVDIPQFEKRTPRFDQFISNENKAQSAQNTAASQQTARDNQQSQFKKNEEVISVNRWQDLQSQLGRRQSQNSNPTDYSIPSILRYQRNDEDNR
ncbi:MAG: cell division protein FtsZ [Sphaerochaeta sp.]